MQNKGGSFSKSSRPDIANKSGYPGPGSYKHLSEFIHWFYVSFLIIISCNIHIKTKIIYFNKSFKITTILPVIKIYYLKSLIMYNKKHSGILLVTKVNIWPIFMRKNWKDKYSKIEYNRSLWKKWINSL